MPLARDAKRLAIGERINTLNNEARAAMQRLRRVKTQLGELKNDMVPGSVFDAADETEVDAASTSLVVDVQQFADAF